MVRVQDTNELQAPQKQGDFLFCRDRVNRYLEKLTSISFFRLVSAQELAAFDPICRHAVEPLVRLGRNSNNLLRLG